VLASDSELNDWSSPKARGFPVIAAIARIHELAYKSHTAALIARPGENPRATVSVADRMLPDGVYLMLTTPERDFRSTETLLNAFAGVVRLSHGNNVAHALVLEGTVDSVPGEMFMHLPTLNVPQPLDGPRLRDTDFTVREETFRSLSAAKDAPREGLNKSTDHAVER
jgi:hypothetical protein